MKEYAVVDGPDLRLLLLKLDGNEHELHKVSFALDGGLKVKINEGIWSAPLGRIEEAQ